MPGLVPGIHVFLQLPRQRRGWADSFGRHEYPQAWLGLGRICAEQLAGLGILVAQESFDAVIDPAVRPAALGRDLGYGCPEPGDAASDNGIDILGSRPRRKDEHD